MISLAELFPEGQVRLSNPRDQATAIDDLARRAAAALGLQPSAIAADLARREAMGSTGIGGGIALPHARLAGLRQPYAMFVRLAQPIAWQAIDQRKVDLLFLLLSPDESADIHLKVLAMVTRRLRDRELAAALRSAPDAEAMRGLLIGSPSAPPA